MEPCNYIKICNKNRSGEFTINCPKCGKDFSVSFEVDVRFATELK